MEKLRISTGKTVVSVTAPSHAEAKEIAREVEESRSTYQTPRDMYKALYGKKDFPDL